MNIKKLRPILLLALVAALSSVVLWNSLSADSGWQAQYFNNRSLEGAPSVTRVDPNIDFNWTNGSPASEIQADNFSARWSRTVNLPEGRYRFTMMTDNGSRLWVNNQLVVNQFWDHPPTTHTAEVQLPGGNVPIKMEYFESGFTAEAHLSWQQIGGNENNEWNNNNNNTAQNQGQWNNNANANNNQNQGQWNNGNNNQYANTSTCGSNNWQGTFWNNAFLKGNPNHSRTDRAINFNWGNSAPAQNIPNDQWSARWTSMHELPEGLYRLNLTSDDGAIVWVNEKKVVDLWYDHTSMSRNGEYYHEGGMVTVRVEYYDQTGPAALNLYCQNIQPTPRPWPTRTPVPYVPATAVPWVPATPVPWTPQPWPTATPAPPQPTADPLQTANAGMCTISHVDVLNIRSEPSLNAGVVSQVVRGEKTTLTGGRNGDWWQVRKDNGQIGWINKYYCGAGQAPAAPAPAPAPQTQAFPVVMVDVAALYVRTGPATSYNWVDIVYFHDNVQLTGQRNADGTWVTIRTYNGHDGWAYAPYLWLTPDDINNLSVVSTARSSAGSATVNVGGLNVRAEANTNGAIIAGLYYGQTVELFGTRTLDSQWVTVILSDGTIGWAYAPYLNLSVPIANLQPV